MTRNWGSRLRGEIEDRCMLFARNHNGYFVITIKSIISIIVLFLALLPTWFAILLFVLISRVSDIQPGEPIRTLLGIILTCSFFMPQFWIGIFGLSLLVLIVLA